MTREQAKELLPILSAFADGGAIQHECAAGWEDRESPDFHSFPARRFRIKPEPREWEIGIHGFPDSFGEKDIACCISAAGQKLKGCDCKTKIRVREILD